MILDSFKLDGKVAIITGAGRGLGRAMAVRFANCGADVVAAARTVSQLEETAAEVRKIGRKCLIVRADVSDSSQVNAMAAAALKEFGRSASQSRRSPTMSGIAVSTITCRANSTVRAPFCRRWSGRNAAR
jgi:NAD(P)-dependent dehydrogenase (short-subunit alcohol dehydrogenase family)